MRTLAKHRNLTRIGIVALTVLALGARAQSPDIGVDLTADAVQPAVLFVTLGDHYFAPASFTVRVGQTVRFELTTVGRSFRHDFLIMPAGSPTVLAGHPAIIPFATGASVDWTPTEAGTYRIACAVCPWMTGVIHVVA